MSDERLMNYFKENPNIAIRFINSTEEKRQKFKSEFFKMVDSGNLAIEGNLKRAQQAESPNARAYAIPEENFFEKFSGINPDNIMDSANAKIFNTKAPVDYKNDIILDLLKKQNSVKTLPQTEDIKQQAKMRAEAEAAEKAKMEDFKYLEATMHNVLRRYVEKIEQQGGGGRAKGLIASVGEWLGDPKYSNVNAANSQKNEAGVAAARMSMTGQRLNLPVIEQFQKSFGGDFDSVESVIANVRQSYLQAVAKLNPDMTPKEQEGLWRDFLVKNNGKDFLTSLAEGFKGFDSKADTVARLYKYTKAGQKAAKEKANAEKTTYSPKVQALLKKYSRG